MAKQPAVNPLGAIAKKPASYVGDLDDLLDQVSDDSAPSIPKRGEVLSAQKRKTSKKEMKIDVSEDEDVPRSRINLLLPTELHRQFKVRAATEGVTMTSLLEAFIRDYVKSGL